MPVWLVHALFTLVASFAFQSSARAQEVHGAIGVVTDYVVHGLTRSDSDPVLQGSVSATVFQDTTVGAWASTVNLNPGPGANGEYAFFVAHRLHLNIDFAFDAKLARYIYPDDPGQIDYDYTDLRAALIYRESIELAVEYSPDWSMYTRYGPTTDRRAIWTELSVTYPVDPVLSLTGGMGYTDLSDHDRSDYVYFSAGMEWRWRRVVVALSYIGTDNDAKRLFSSDNAGNRVVGSLIWVIR